MFDWMSGTAYSNLALWIFEKRGVNGQAAPRAGHALGAGTTGVAAPFFANPPVDAEPGGFASSGCGRRQLFRACKGVTHACLDPSQCEPGMALERACTC